MSGSGGRCNSIRPRRRGSTAAEGMDSITATGEGMDTTIKGTTGGEDFEGIEAMEVVKGFGGWTRWVVWRRKVCF